MQKGLTGTEKNKFAKIAHLPSPIGSRSQRLESKSNKNAHGIEVIRWAFTIY